MYIYILKYIHIYNNNKYIYIYENPIFISMFCMKIANQSWGIQFLITPNIILVMDTTKKSPENLHRKPVIFLRSWGFPMNIFPSSRYKSTT